MILRNTYACPVKSDELSAFTYETKALIKTSFFKFIFFQIFRPFLGSTQPPFQKS